MEQERENLRDSMHKIIDELKKLLEEETQNMGAAGKRREDELLAEIANLRRELAERAARIDELKTSLDGLNKTVAQRDSTIAEL